MLPKYACSTMVSLPSAQEASGQIHVETYDLITLQDDEEATPRVAICTVAIVKAPSARRAVHKHVLDGVARECYDQAWDYVLLVATAVRSTWCVR